MAKIEFQKNSDNYKIVMFGKINFQGDQQTVALFGALFLALACAAGAVRRRATPQFGMSPWEPELKFERYCDTGIGFAMTKVDMACGA